MRVEELRVGNFVRHEGNVKEIANIIGKVSKSVEFMSWKKVHISNIEPIELTEEILLKCGFEPTYFVSNNKLASYRIYNIDFLNPDFTLVWFKTKIEYLHQLQNLYFALTNKELEINL